MEEDVQRAAVDTLTDVLGMPVDQGIREIVAALRLAGFSTTGSCEGHLNRALQYPWVDICASEPDGWDVNAGASRAWRLQNHRLARGLHEAIDVFAVQHPGAPLPRIVPKEIYGAFRLIVDVQIGSAGIPSTACLEESRAAFREFASFLRERAAGNRQGRPRAAPRHQRSRDGRLLHSQGVREHEVVRVRRAMGARGRDAQA